MAIFLLLPPNLLALVNYRTVRLVVSQSPVYSSRFWLKPKFVTLFFIISNEVSISMQSIGGGIVTTEKYARAGRAI
ncbi:hypothetical protein GGI12_003525, partial [Dipsacomyces acuminosporus]